VKINNLDTYCEEVEEGRTTNKQNIRKLAATNTFFPIIELPKVLPE
jgi:hypothetical protein